MGSGEINGRVASFSGKQSTQIARPGTATCFGNFLSRALTLAVLAVTIQPTHLRADERPIYECAKAPGAISVDCALDQFAAAPRIYLRDREHVTGSMWGGVDDLSATARILFDHDHLYLLVEVTDNDMCWPDEAEGAWSSDSVQIAFDPQLDGGFGAYRPDDTELTLSQVDGQPSVWRQKPRRGRPPGQAANIPMHVGRHPDMPGWYLIASLPWAELGVDHPDDGTTVGFNLLVNDRDTGRQRIFMEWTPGIGLSKSPSQFGRLLLVAKANAAARTEPMDPMHPNEWSEKHIDLSGTPDADAVDEQAKLIADQAGIYCWWNLWHALPPGTYQVYARMKGEGTFGLQVCDAVADRGIIKLPPRSIDAARYQVFALGRFEYDGSYALRLSDWSTPGLSVDYVAVVAESDLTRAKANERAEHIAKQATDLEALLTLAESEGIDVADQRITYHVAMLFGRYGVDDVDHGKLRRAENVFAFLDDAVPEAIGEVKAKLKRGGPNAFSPPDVTELQWRRGHFYANDRPVFLWGALDCPPDISVKLGMNYRYTSTALFNYLTDVDRVNNQAIGDTARQIREARAAGLAVTVLLGNHYFPNGILQQYPETRHVGPHKSFCSSHCIDSPTSRRAYATFFEHAVPAWAGEGLLCLELANELGYACRCTYTHDAFRTYLARQYATPANLSAAWGRQIRSFNDADMPPESTLGAARYDWLDFNQKRLLQAFGWMDEQVHSAAPDLATEVKIVAGRALDGTDITWGIDHEAFAQLMTFAGQDTYFAEAGEAHAMIYDLYRSLAEGRPVVDHESPFIRPGVTAEHVRFNMWVGAVHGEAAAAIWIWNRTEEKPDVEDCLATQPWSAEAMGRTVHELNRLAPQIVEIATVSPPVRIVYSRASSLMSTDRHLSAMQDSYLALLYSGAHIGFITERQLADRKYGKSKVIVVPEVHHFPDTALAGLAAFAKRGGTVVLVGDCQFRTERDAPRPINHLTDSPRVVSVTDARDREAFSGQMSAILDQTDVRGCPGARLGLEARAVTLDDGSELRVYLNYDNSQSFKVATQGNATDLLTGASADVEISVPPLGVALIRVDPTR